ncbi:hypothetical protein L596_019077 [Steinernema carpocapsae]|uniref:SXP/RAL-2 family protein Ani s 5-like cation-binding domain-containing protein n=1 Tax=Steinernema carpocapsae TaxID=34508 RepID=A0A4U5N6S1_STECR|nr:hypothetical protein L596_019077 [Steinernema carpocapsae]
MILATAILAFCLCWHSTVSFPVSQASPAMLRIPYRSHILRPFVDSQRRTKFMRSIDEYESDRVREKSKARLEKLTEILQESINEKADDAAKEIKENIQSSRKTLSRLLKDFSDWNSEKTLIYRPG